MADTSIDTLIRERTPLQNPDGTENQVAVTAVNDLAARLSKKFAVPATTGGRRRTYRRRRKEVLRAR